MREFLLKYQQPVFNNLIDQKRRLNDKFKRSKNRYLEVLLKINIILA